MKVTVTKNLNVRIGKPRLDAPNHEFLVPGSVIETDGKLYRGDVYDGNFFWYKDMAGNYYWSGGIDIPETEPNNTFSKATEFIDFHCHSILKPYSKSFRRKKTRGKNTIKNKKRSIWHKTKLNILKKIGNAFISVTKFTQADFKSAYKGGAKILMVSIDPMERELVLSKNRKKPIADGLFLDFFQGIGKRRMNYLERLNDYFADLKQSYLYLDDLQNIPIKIGDKMVSYKMVSTYEEIDLTNEEIINIIPTMEGGHVFRSNLDSNLTKREIENQVLDNIKEVKLGFGEDDSKVTPFFVSLSHHFKNGLCGHADSLKKARAAYNQEANPKDGFEELGIKVIEALLSKTYGKRILIDVKHMNLKSRKFYYFNELRIKEEVPIIVSHGATNNLSWPEKDDTEINFYKEEIPIIAKSGGIFGIQLDARRLREADYGFKRRGLNSTIKREGLYKRAFFVWRQVEMMALYIYEKKDTEFGFEDIDPWGFQVIGSDFDGVVDPLDGFWTHSEMPLLCQYLIVHAKTFLKTNKAKRLPNYEDLNAENLVEKFMFQNAQEFLIENFTAEKRGV